MESFSTTPAPEDKPNGDSEKKDKQPINESRRMFLKKGAALIGGAVAAGAGATMVNFLSKTKDKQESSLENAEPGQELEEFRKNIIRRMDAENKRGMTNHRVFYQSTLGEISELKFKMKGHIDRINENKELSLEEKYLKFERIVRPIEREGIESIKKEMEEQIHDYEIKYEASKLPRHLHSNRRFRRGEPI